LRAAEQDRPNVAQKRRRWRGWQGFMDPARFVFLDETATTTAMARRYGRRAQGARLVAAVPYGHWKTTTFIAGLRASGVIAPLVLDGPMTGPAFRAYAEQFLAPALKPGDVVVLDNLSAHKVDGVRQAIVRAGASILYLPPYSPDLAPGSQPRPPTSVRSGAPIEQLFAKLKALLRRAAARTRDELWSTIGQVLAAIPSTGRHTIHWPPYHPLAAIPSTECANYLVHSGYGST
jgi:transposase